MAGGSGTRFWPKSRRNRPKQLLRLHGDRTMIQHTVDRVAPLVPHDRVWVITGADQAEATRAQLPGLPFDHIVGEPSPRDTAACVGLAAALLLADDPDATMLVMPADHVISPTDLFLQTVSAAVEVVDHDPSALVTFGISPTRPETGYGYIERGRPDSPRNGIAVHQVVRFREKPDRPTAEAFLRAGNFVWNAGIFVWKARTILDALRQYRPGVADGIDQIASALGRDDAPQVIETVYPSIERIPIDKAVMELAPNVKVLEVQYDWNDVGDWRALSALIPPDPSGNTLDGPIHAVDTRNCIIVSDDRKLICTLGVEDLVIVQSGDATLVARRDQLDKLKALVEGLGAAGFPEVL